MVRLRYSFPSDVALTPDCRDLLHRMLLPDPSERIKIPEILRHPWFIANLPPRATAMNDRYLAATEAAPGAQSQEAIHAVIAEAQASGRAARALQAQQAAVRAAAVWAASKEDSQLEGARGAVRQAVSAAGRCGLSAQLFGPLGVQGVSSGGLFHQPQQSSPPR